MNLIDVLKKADKVVFKHQLDFVTDALLVPRFRALLADDVGLGKTVQASLLIRILFDAGLVDMVLVVVPRATFEHWRRELRLFGIKVHEIERPSSSLSALTYTVHMVTMDRAKREEYLDKLLRRMWDLVIVDEAHRLRPSIEREKVGKLCSKAKRCLLLTATPHTGIPKHYSRLAALAEYAVIRREKRDVEEYEERRIFPRLRYWVSYVRAGDDVAVAAEILNILERALGIDDIVLAVAKKRALSSPVAFLKTLHRIVKGEDCDVDRGELDACLSGLADNEELRTLAGKYAYAHDGKLLALMTLLDELRKDRWKKVVIFTEYATTAEYVFRNLTHECKIVEEGDGYGRAYCGDVGVMYADYRARSRWEDLERVVSVFADSHDSAVFISTDIMSEGVDLNLFHTVVNYEVVWSPTKHMQRVGRIWRLGQRYDEVLVVDLVGNTAEREYYDMLMEKLYNVSKVALAPIASSGTVEIREIEEEDVRKVLEISSAPVYISEEEAFNAIVIGRDVEGLHKIVKRVLNAKRLVRCKPRRLVEEGLRAKLGLGDPTPGPGEYYMALVKYYFDDKPLYSEYVLVDNRGNVYKGVQIAHVDIEALDDASSDMVSGAVEKMVEELREYASKASNYVRFLNKVPEKLTYRVLSVKRVKVKPRDLFNVVNELTIGSEPWAVSELWNKVKRVVRESEDKARIEQAAVECVKQKLAADGYRIVHDYVSTARPFDVVVERGSELYLVEIKGKSADRANEPILFTENEIEWAREHPDKYLIYVAYVDGDQCTDVKYFTFAEFQKEWDLQKANCQYVAIPKSSQLPFS